MKELTVAKVYAKSLLEIGDEHKVNIADELTLFTETINKSNDLENILFLDVFTTDEKRTFSLKSLRNSAFRK
jgi:F-type H+-transporting ATPase subunit delta